MRSVSGVGGLLRERLSASLRTPRVQDNDDDVLSERASARELVPGKGRRSQIWRKADRRNAEYDREDVAAAHDAAEHLRSTGSALPDALRKRLESELGVELGGIRLHTDERAAAAASRIGARAFVIGTDIFFADGAYDPESVTGIELIAHEVAHVAQHVRGIRASEAIVAADDQTEHQADAFARSFTTKTADPQQDPAELVNRMRAQGQRMDLPSRALLEEKLGHPLDFVEMYTGDAARLACGLLSAGAFAVRNVVALADPSPQRELLLHELAHVIQMGGANSPAPATFAPASLRVSNDSDVAEHDARHVARGGNVNVSADSNTIHRNPAGQAPTGNGAASGGDSKWELEDAVKAFKEKFVPNIIKRKPGEDFYFFVEDKAEPDGKYLYETSSTDTFQRQAYQHAIGHTSETDKKKSEKDLLKIRDSGSWSDVGLVHVEPGEPTKDSRRWAWVDDKKEKLKQSVKYVFEEERAKSTPAAQWKKYCEAVETCHTKGSLLAFKQITIGGRSFAFDGKRHVAANEVDNSIFREELEKAVLADKQFAWREKSGWKVYYDHIAKESKLPQGLAGEIFKNLVKRDLGAAGEQFGEGEAFFYHPQLQTKTRKRQADGFSLNNTQLLLEAKSGQAKGPADNEDSELKKQAQDYANILRLPVEAYHPTDAASQGPFTQIIYTFQTPQIAAAWAPKLKEWFGDQADKLLIIPPPGTIGVVQAKTNPTFNIPLTDKNTTNHHFKQPPFVHSGMKVREAVIKTKAPGSSELAPGSTLTYDVDLGNKVVTSSKPVTKTLTPEAGSAGRFDSAIDGLESSLKKIFKRLTTDAKLVDGGVEATITVTPGDSGIPGLSIVDPTSIKVRFIDGNLQVVGAVGISDSKGRFTSKVTVGYASGEWTFEGSVEIPKDIVPGLSAFTGTVKYESGKWTIGADGASYEHQFGTIRLHGQASSLSYNVDKGSFDGFLRLNADLGMFGSASATADLKANKLTNASFSYDSPELKYPAKSEKPAFTGTIGGTLKYDDGKFSGDVRGTAKLNIPALKAVAGEEGAGLAVDAHVNADGTYSGTVKTTSPLKFGKHLEVPSISCTLDKEGALSGDFEIKVVKIKHIENASIKCSVSKNGIEVKDAGLEFTFGSEEKNKFWGTLKVEYKQATGLNIGGQINYKIKEGMIATGTLKYSTQTHAVSLEMKVSEISLLDKTIPSKPLFKISKQIPVVNYGIGIYIDIGFDLGFEYGFKLGLKPTVSFEELSLETWQFKQIEAKLELLGLIFAQLTGTPKIGVGLFAGDPSIVRGGGGLKMPIVGRAEIKPSGTIGLQYTPDGGTKGQAKIGMSASFGITGSLKPYADFSILNDLWNPSWTGEALTSFEILKPKELFNFEVDLAGDMTKKDAPPLPETGAPKDATAPTGDRTFEAKKGESSDMGPGANKDQPAVKNVKEGGDGGPFDIDSILGKLKGVPAVATAEKIFKMATKVWDAVKPYYKIIKPIFDLIADRVEEFMSLFDTELPKSASEIMPWAWKLAKKVLNLSFGGLPELAQAIVKIGQNLVGGAQNFIDQAVKDGWIGVKRWSYYIWTPPPFDNYDFMAASEFKVNIPGVVNLGQHGPDRALVTPSSAVALVLYKALEGVGVGYTYRGKSDINEPYNDFWTGAGARG